MQAASSTHIPQVQNSTQTTPDVTPAFIYLYDQTIDSSSIKFCMRLTKNSRLQAHAIEFDNAKTTIAAVSEKLGACKDKSNHLLLNVHGCSVGSKGKRTHRFFAGAGPRRDHSTRKWLENLLCKSAQTTTPNYKSLPFIHVLSCEAKALSHEIKPGSELWKSGWFIVYSSSKISSINHFGNSLDIMASYVELCESHDKQADPLTLFYLAGLARGDCISLLGGDLQQPLTLHAPKSLRDLKPVRSIKLLEGSTQDKSRLLLAGIELTPSERSLLPDSDDAYLSGQLLAARVQRNDIDSVNAISKVNPKLVNNLQSGGSLPLACAVHMGSEELILSMLSLGADINATDIEGDSILFSALTDDKNNILKLLLERGANPNCPNYQSETPLLAAIKYKNIEAAKLLINYGADTTWVDGSDTALTLAVRKGQLSVVQCLLQQGADHRSGLSTALVQQAYAAGREDIAFVLEQALSKIPARKKYDQ